MGEVMDSVAAVAIYPLKSAHKATVNGEIPTSLPVGPTGFEVNGVRDHDFVLYDPNANKPVAQRGYGMQKRVVYPGDRTLAMVEVDIREDHVAISSRIGQLLLSAIPVEGEQTTIPIWNKVLPVVDQGPDPARYFTQLFGRDLRLMRADRARPRVLPAHYRRVGATNQVAGADGYAFHLVSQTSHDAQLARNHMRPEALSIDRWRASIIMVGAALGPFGEDYIDPDIMFYIGAVGEFIVKATPRCSIPNGNQETAVYDGAATRALRGRAGEITAGGDTTQGIFFGQYLVHAWKPGQKISERDEVKVLSLSTNPNVRLHQEQEH